ncbi:MAG TPA: response regulator transcription factor [Ktedonobacterales bacterium]|nr:response regulator transcription factor [Ktedonobacterales bacterium]
MESPLSVSRRSVAHQTIPPRILIVDDIDADARGLNNTMTSRGYDLKVASLAKEALAIAKSWKPQVAILDVNIPDMNGLDLSQRIKDCADNPIVIFVTSDGSTEMRRRCFQAGDDYLPKPYDGEQLVLTIQSRLRRYDEDRGAAADGKQFTLPINPVAGPLHLPDGRAVMLTVTEARLLSALASRAGETASREFLMEQVWGDEYEVYGDSLDSYIFRLRRKIEPDPKRPRIIITKRCEGYLLDLGALRRLR